MFRAMSGQDVFHPDHLHAIRFSIGIIVRDSSWFDER